VTGTEPLNGNVIPFPTQHARDAAKRIGASAAEIDAVAESIEQIVAEIHRIVAADNAKRDLLLKDWKS
jgi:hypothetical protein